MLPQYRWNISVSTTIKARIQIYLFTYLTRILYLVHKFPFCVYYHTVTTLFGYKLQTEIISCPSPQCYKISREGP